MSLNDVVQWAALIGSVVAIIVAIRKAPLDLRKLEVEGDKTASDAWKELLKPTQEELERERTARKSLEARIVILEKQVGDLESNGHQKDLLIGYLKGGIEVLTSQLEARKITPHFTLASLDESVEIKKSTGEIKP